MATRNTEKGAAVDAYLKTCKKVGQWKSKAAREIFKQYPGLFSSVESARNVLRYRTEAKGKYSRGSTNFLPDNTQIDVPAFVTNKHKYVSHRIKESGLLIISDTHIPYGDKEAIRAMLTWARDMKERIGRIILNGDSIDFKRISHWRHDPLDIRVLDEITIFQEFLALLRKLFPNVPIDMREGNHEFRWQDYLFRKAEELSELEEIQLDRVLQLAKYGVNWVPNKITVKFGKLNILHGHEYGRSIFSPVNPARGLFNRGMGANAICGHFHRTSEHIWVNLDEETKGTWSIGCLCDLYPDYAPKPFNVWNHGFAFVEQNDEGDFEVHNKIIIDGKVT